MPSLPHDALVTLFRNRPALAPDLLRDALHLALPAFDTARIGDVTLTEIVPTEYRADLVLLLEGPEGTPPRAALVVEVQLARDADKRWSWPVYLTGLRARLRCDVALVVVAMDTGVASWAATPIPTGHPGWALTPLVLGPAVVPTVRDERVATVAPELAVLSAMLHGRGDDALRIARTALAAARDLDDERASLYADLVLLSVSDAVRATLEEVMASGHYEYQSDFARRYFGQGKAEGRATALLAVLAARGVDVPEDVRTRIASCTDLAVLDGWLVRAATAATLSDVIGEGTP